MMATLINEVLPSIIGTAVTTALVTPYITGWYEARLAALLARVRGYFNTAREDARDW